MRKISLLIVFLFSANAVFACQCRNEWASTNNRYITSDYVGKVEITKVFPSESKTDKYYQTKIKSIETFKGKVPQYLKIYGNHGFENGIIFGCSTGVEEGEIWLIYTNKDSTGNYNFSSCTFPQRLQNADASKVELSDNEKRDLQQLAFLRETVPHLNRNFMINEDSNQISKYVQQYKNQKFGKPSAEYLVTFDKDMQISNIETLRGFSDSFDKNFIHFLKAKSKWYAGDMGVIKKAREYHLQTSTKHVIGVYYYVDGNKRFLSAYDLP